MVGIFCGKLLACPVRDITGHVPVQETRMNAGLLALSTVKPFNGMAALRGPRGDFTDGDAVRSAQACPVVIQAQAKPEPKPA